MVTLSKGMATRVSIPAMKSAAPVAPPPPATAPIIKASGNSRIQEMLKKGRSNASPAAPSGSALARMGAAAKPGNGAPPPAHAPAPSAEQYAHFEAGEVKDLAANVAAEIASLSGALSPVWKIQQMAVLNSRTAFSPETSAIVRSAEISLAAASLTMHRLNAALAGSHGVVLAGSEIDLLESLGQYAARLRQTLG